MFCVVVAFAYGCNKNKFLDKKPNSNIIVPKSLSDLKQLLEYNTELCPALGQLCSDDYYYPDLASWSAAFSETERNSYLWARDIYNGEKNIVDWYVPYRAIFYANVVLEQYQQIAAEAGTQADARLVQGWAYFLRANAFYNLLQTFSPAYDSLTENIDLGLPVRTTANINVIGQRSSLGSSYRRVLGDLSMARDLLPETIDQTDRKKPTRLSVYSLFARIYLSMRKYDKAFVYADSALRTYSSLMDFNTLSTTLVAPFSVRNEEIIYFSTVVYNWSATISGNSARCPVDTNLYKSYSPNDLRKSIYFRTGTDGRFYMKQGYNAASYPFNGLATNEMYLIRAECYARSGRVSEAMTDLSMLLKKRWKSSVPYVPLTAASASAALSIILLERRKELIWKGLRWSDLKRLNKEGANIILRRVLDGREYILQPNSPLYVLPIPDDEIAMTGIQQNVR